MICLCVESISVTKNIHRLVAKAFFPDFNEDLEVDHRDGVKLNNWDSNLRMLTPSQNQHAHMITNADASSKYRGVHQKANSNKWVAEIKNGNRNIYLGTFSNEIDAAKAWNARAVGLGYLSESLNII